MSELTREFEARYGGPPTVTVRAPGRVNLIGEHTDYNDGFVLPMAIDREVRIALRPRPDRLVQVHSMEFNESRIFPLSCIEKDEGWIEYVKGVASRLEAPKGWEGVMQGNVPIGAGLSSSAATEMAAARAFAEVSGLDWDPVAMAKLCQEAENEWVGMNCGIMDPLISAAGGIQLIDCRALTLKPFAFSEGTAVAVLDTATRRELTDSKFNERRTECEEAARRLGVPALRDATRKQVEGLEDPLRRRARHVVSENERTLAAASADPRQFGRLMNESHASLHTDYEVTNEALDVISEIARAQPGCYGARMTGAGFGGCAVALIDAEADFAPAVTEAYRARTGLDPKIYVCRPAEGAGCC